jgi:hypothetical protein
MPKRRLIVGIVVVGIAVVIIFAFTRPREPTYKGQPLSHWVNHYLLSGLGVDAAEREADEALKHIGPKAIPYLLTWLRTEVPASTNGETDSMPLCFGTPDAFRALGSEARSAVPDRLKLAHERTNSLTACLAILCLGKIPLEDMSPLFNLLTNEERAVRESAWEAIRSQGTNAAHEIPLLVRYYTEKPDGFGAEALGALAMRPNLVVPALGKSLSETSAMVRVEAAQALGAHGPRAREAVPDLVKLLQDTNRHVRGAATNALLKIAPEALTNAPSK